MKCKRMLALLLTAALVLVTCTGAFAAPPEGEERKEETVYVIADASGTPSSILVSTWLQNPKGAGTLSDRSSLSDLEVLKGNATYSLDKDGALLWQADGEDVYYRGSAEEPLPVELTLSYFLDGSPISAQDLAGKSGRVTIRFTYKNTTRQTVTLGDRTEEIPIPFLVLSGLMLDGKDFSNVEAESGQVISDGDRFFVAGFAIPGLREDLGEAGKELDLPETFAVTADTTNFHLDATLTLVVTDLLQGLDLDGLDSLEELTGSLDALDEGARELMDGSSALYEGLETLLDSTGTLQAGTQELYSGSGTLYAGLRELQGSCRRWPRALTSWPVAPALSGRAWVISPAGPGSSSPALARWMRGRRPFRRGSRSCRRRAAAWQQVSVNCSRERGAFPAAWRASRRNPASSRAAQVSSVKARLR